MKKLVSLVATLVLATGTVAGLATVADAAPVKAPTGISLPASKVSGTVKTGAKPKVMNYTVDSGYMIIDIKWKTWGVKKAVGYGVARTNNCIPNCAETTSVHYLDVVLTASQPKKGKFTIVSVERAYNGDEGVTLTK